MRISSFILLVALGYGATTWAAEKSASVSQEASLQIQGVRLNRPTPGMNAGYGSYYSGDNSQGVNLQLLLTLKQGMFVATRRDSIQIETFIDDTYQSLLGSGPGTSYYNEQNLAVSEDGASLLFNVNSSRPLANEATRVFVRGKVDTRMIAGEQKAETARLPLVVGERVTVGPFGATLKTVNDNGIAGVMLTLAVEDNSGRIRKVRVLDVDESGKVLNDPKQTRLEYTYHENVSPVYNPISLFVTLQRPSTNAVTLEFTFAEKTERISVPFEAQVDLGVTKAGPVTIKESLKKPREAAPRRAWPPPPIEQSNPLPPRRPGFTPETKPGPTGK